MDFLFMPCQSHFDAGHSVDMAGLPVMLPRSDGGEYPRFWTNDEPVVTLLIYEKTIPTLEKTPETAARVSEPQLQQKRAGHFKKSAPRGTKAANAGIILPWGQKPSSAFHAPPASKKAVISAAYGRKGSDW